MNLDTARSLDSSTSLTTTLRQTQCSLEGKDHLMTDAKVTGKDYKVVTSQLALILQERLQTARSRGLNPPFDMCVTGADDIAMQCSVGEDGTCHDLASGEELDFHYSLGDVKLAVSMGLAL